MYALHYIQLGPISAVSRVRSLILPEQRLVIEPNIQCISNIACCLVLSLFRQWNPR